ncbi:MAG: glycoside hydrolase family 28 protein, partial [Verrucomicrobiota bacterium]|nr:glycoside hydrolase family 28 protein [Verrucomicrobiota bacterium]
MKKFAAFAARFACFLFLLNVASGLAAGAQPGDDWAEAGNILARIKAPQFPARDFAIIDYGAVAGGTQDCTGALRQAIEACHAAGGGRVVVPAGEFLTGAIHLLSNVNLYLAPGATLRFSTDPAAYMPVVFTRWESTECMNYSPFIYADGQENIAITGSGTLDGAASDANWWRWAQRGANRKSRATADVKALNDMGERDVPVEKRVFGAGHYLRPNFIQPLRCRNVLIEGITIHRSPMWEINPVLCTNVIVRHVTIDSDGPNNDGCDPECSRDVLIEDCSFATGDDCIAIKSGRNNDGRRVGVAAENIIVRRCAMHDGHAGVAIGSEVSGGCRNVFVEECRMDSPRLDRALRIKSNARRGGVIENIFMRNIQIGHVAEAVLTVDFLYEEGEKGSFPPTVRHVSIEKVTVRSTPRIMWIVGFKGATIDDIRFANCNFSGVLTSEVVQYAGRITLENVFIHPAQEIHGLDSR